MLAAWSRGGRRGTVTFLFTDVEDSTGWWDRLPGEMRRALERHDRILEQAVTAHGGLVFLRGGDGVTATISGRR
jgi:class 3 adenylate cyclase